VNATAADCGLERNPRALPPDGVGGAVKRLVDRSTSFFWAASCGQIYPELRRPRRRVRYELTASGRVVLLEWLRAPSATYALRDEALLKVFFADALEPDESIKLVRAFRGQQRVVLDRLYEVEASRPVDAGVPAVALP
jgi:Virulence activator alpha C-term